MEISIFAKRRQTKDGRTFYTYLTTLTKKDGTEVRAVAKFNLDRCSAPKPENCPCNIIVDKANCNFNSRRVVNQATGEIIESNTLWIEQYAMGSEWEDHSMDDFED